MRGWKPPEQVIRAGLLKLGGGILEQLLAADRGHRGPRVPCGNGHEALFAGYRDKSFDTVLGLVTVTRAWYSSPPARAAWHPATPSSASRPRRCRRAWPR